MTMQNRTSEAHADWPKVRTAGFDGFLISFADKLTEPANRAALSFRDAVERAGWAGVKETSTSLVSTYLRFDPHWRDHTQMRQALNELLAEHDWFAEALPQGRKLWRVPTVYGTALAPQLDEAAQAAGMSTKDAIRQISETRVRVQTIGFAPGQPYLGELPKAWDIPRQQALTDKVPIGALVVAIRQLIVFSVSTPTGWRHIGQTAFRLFRPEADEPFILRPGDEVLFTPTTAEKLRVMQDNDVDGGASFEVIT